VTDSDDLLRTLATRLELRETPCPTCARSVATSSRSCWNCAGKGRLWLTGMVTLSDGGLLRLARFEGLVA
jgi:hypothetical protein